MTAANPNRPGAINGGADKKALFEQVFTGEVLTRFEMQNKTKDRVQTRTITHGKSAEFHVMGDAQVEYHVPGNEILGSQILHGQRIININGLLISHVFIPNIDEAMASYDVRGPYSTEMGNKLANTWDKHVLQVGVLAARTATPAVTGGPVGSVITELAANDFDDADKLVQALSDAKTKLLEKDVPEDEIVAYLPYARIHKLVTNGKAINRDFGGNGSIATGKITEVMGIELVGTNNMPTANVVAGSVLGGDLNGYVGNFTKTKGLVMHRSAVGTVKLLDLAVESQYDIRRQGTLVVAKYAVGHGVLRPESAIELAGL